jgi:hypothetical protein
MRRLHIWRRQSIISFALGLLALLLVSSPVSAGVGWCRADPIVTINGSPLQMWVSIPEIYQPYVKGPIRIRIAVPVEIGDLAVTHLDEGFNGYGEEVIWATHDKPVRPDGTIPVKVRVKVEFNRKALKADFGPGVKVPVRVEVIYDGESQWYEGTHTQTKFVVAVTADSEQTD